MNLIKRGAVAAILPAVIAVLAAGCSSSLSATAPATVSASPSTSTPAMTTAADTPTMTATTTTTAPTATTTTPPASGAPSLSIVQPVANIYVVGTSDVTVVVQVSGFDLVDKIGQANVPGQGHLVYSVHEDSPGPPLTATPEAPVSSAATSHTWTGLIESQYTFSVELVNNDGTPLSPSVVARTTVSVYPGG